jgi:putative intracellular protease/amidase
VPQAIAVLIVPGFADWEFGMITGAGRAFYGVGVTFASPDGRPVTSMGGLTATPDRAMATLDPGDFAALALIGGVSWEGPAQVDAGPLARRFLGAGKVVGAICGGTTALARAGLLDGVAHTSNGPGYLDAHVPAYRGAAHYLNQPRAVRDGLIVTAPGTAPASFAIEMLRAAGVAEGELASFAAMLAAEHAA